MNRENKTTLADDDRSRLCLEATWEISAIATLINVAIDHLDEGDFIAIKGVMKRLTYLNELIMVAVSDPLETTEELRGLDLLSIFVTSLKVSLPVH